MSVSYAEGLRKSSILSDFGTFRHVVLLTGLCGFLISAPLALTQVEC